MMHSEMVGIVQKWFNKTGGGGLVLPDGWYGRPYDNLHRLTDIKSVGNVLRIELDDRLVLDFQKPITARIVDSNLLIEGFENLLFDWQEYGSNEKHSTNYSSGVVSFVPPIGSVVD